MLIRGCKRDQSSIQVGTPKCAVNQLSGESSRTLGPRVFSMRKKRLMPTLSTGETEKVLGVVWILIS